MSIAFLVDKINQTINHADKKMHHFSGSSTEIHAWSYDMYESPTLSGSVIEHVNMYVYTVKESRELELVYEELISPQHVKRTEYEIALPVSTRHPGSCYQPL